MDKPYLKTWQGRNSTSAPQLGCRRLLSPFDPGAFYPDLQERPNVRPEPRPQEGHWADRRLVRVGAPAVPLNPDSPLARLLAAPTRPGVVRWIGLRPARRASMVAVSQAMLLPGQGVVGDRWAGRPIGARQVTLLAEEHLLAIAGFLGQAAVAPQQMRRNILVSGINLLALKDWRVRVGAAVLEITGECHPCSRMEETLGPGGYNAVRGQGGVTARVVGAGEVSVGDAVERLDRVSSGGTAAQAG